MSRSISQILNGYGMERFDDPAPPHNNSIMDVVPADSINSLTTSATQSPPLATVAGPSQTASPPPMTVPSSPRSTIQPPQPDAQGVVTRTGDATPSARLLNSREADPAGVSNAVSTELSTAPAPDNQLDHDFREFTRMLESGNFGRQQTSSPSSIMPPQTENSAHHRRTRASYELEEYRRRLATLLTLAEDAPFHPSADNNFLPPNRYIDRFAAIGALMRAYRDLSNNEIDMENTTVGQQRGRLQQIVDQQWQVVENGLTGDIEELDQLMRGDSRDDDHDRGSRSVSTLNDNRSSGSDTPRPREVELEDEDRDYARSSTGRGASIYARGGRGGGSSRGRGQGRGYGSGREESYSDLDNHRSRSRGPPSRDILGSSSSRGGERGRSRERAPWDDVPSLESRLGRDRDFVNRGFTAEEIAFINSGPVDPTSVNAPVARSVESQETTFEGQEGSDYGSGEDNEHGESHEEESEDSEMNDADHEDFYDAEQVVEGNEDLFEEDNRRMRELSMSEEPQPQAVDREADGSEQEVVANANIVAGQDVDQVMETVELVTTPLVEPENEARRDRQDQGREERSMSWE